MTATLLLIALGILLVALIFGIGAWRARRRRDFEQENEVSADENGIAVNKNRAVIVGGNKLHLADPGTYFVAMGCPTCGKYALQRTPAENKNLICFSCFNCGARGTIFRGFTVERERREQGGEK